MAKPKIFLSSTFYDLKQVRADLEIFIKSMGYEPVQNERGNIPYGSKSELETYCYDEIGNVDILVNIVGGRYGSQSNYDNCSISQKEFQTAHDLNKQAYIFIDKNIDSEYNIYLKNKGKDIEYTSVDDIKIFEFIEYVRGLANNNIIFLFETSNDIITILREQWAGLFKRFLDVAVSPEKPIEEKSLVKIPTIEKQPTHVYVSAEPGETREIKKFRALYSNYDLRANFLHLYEKVTGRFNTYKGFVNHDIEKYGLAKVYRVGIVNELCYDITPLGQRFYDFILEEELIQQHNHHESW